MKRAKARRYPFGTAKIEKPAKASAALLITDMINHLEFPGGADMLEGAGSAAEVILELSRQAREAGVPIVYVNDN